MLLQRMRRILYSVLIFILLIFSLAQLTSVKAEDGGDVRRDVVILIDNSRSVALTNDEEGNRIRAARFLAHFLKAVAPENTALGVSRFTLTSTQLVGLKPLSDWTEGDVAKIVAEPCPRDQKEICKGTNRALALQRALRAMGDCGMNDHICDVVLLTDIPLSETDSPPAQKLENMLYNASENGVNTYVVLFNNENRATDEMKWLALESLPIWQKWENNQLVQSIISVTSPVTVTYLYDSIADSMAMENEFSEFGSIVSSGVTTRTLGPFPPLMKQLRVDVIPDPALPDHPLSVQFPGAPPPIKGDFDDYHWLLPDFERLTMTVQGQGLLFYRDAPETMPADLFISAIPPQPKAGKPFSVQAVITGSHVLLDESRTHVQAMLGAGNKAITLSNVAPGVWQYPAHPEDKWPILGAGDYAISANVDVDGEKLPLRLHGDKLHVAESEQVARLSIYPTRVFTDQVIKLTLAYFVDDELVKVPDGGRIKLVSSQFTSSLPLLTLNPSGKMWTMTGTLSNLLNDIDLTSVEVITAEVITDADNHSWTSESTSIQVLKRPRLELSVSKTRAKPGDTIAVTVRVFNISTSDFSPPTLLGDSSYGWTIQNKQAGIFKKDIQVNERLPMLLQAEIHGADSGFSYFTKSEPVLIDVWPYGTLFLLWLIAIFAFVIIIGILSFVKLWLNKRRKRNKVSELLRKVADPDTAEKESIKADILALANILRSPSPDEEIAVKEIGSSIIGCIISDHEDNCNYKEIYEAVIDLVAGGEDFALRILLEGMDNAYRENNERIFEIIYNEKYYEHLFTVHEALGVNIEYIQYWQNSDLLKVVKRLSDIIRWLPENICGEDGDPSSVPVINKESLDSIKDNINKFVELLLSIDKANGIENLLGIWEEYCTDSRLKKEIQQKRHEWKNATYNGSNELLVNLFSDDDYKYNIPGTNENILEGKLACRKEDIIDETT